MSINELRTKIITGQMDADLEEISKAISIRRNMIQDRQAAETRADLRVGQRCWFTNTVRPQYLRGAEIEILQVNRVRVVVRLVNGPIGRFEGSHIPCPVSIISTTNPNQRAVA